jgi:hypothetical protein
VNAGITVNSAIASTPCRRLPALAPSDLTREGLGEIFARLLGGHPVVRGLALAGMQYLPDDVYATLRDTIEDTFAELAVLTPEQLARELERMRTREGRRGIIRAVADHARTD